MFTKEEKKLETNLVLKAVIMYSNASTNSRSSSEVSLPDSLSNLKPYDWKPQRSVSEVAELMKKLPLTSY